MAGLWQGREMKPATGSAYVVQMLASTAEQASGVGRQPAVRTWSRCWLRRQSRLLEWLLRRKNSVVNRVTLGRRRNFYAGPQDWVKEVKHLFAVDGVVPRNKDEHVAGRDDFFLIAPLLLFRRPQAHDLVGGHERALDLVHVRADAVS